MKCNVASLSSVEEHHCNKEKIQSILLNRSGLDLWFLVDLLLKLIYLFSLAIYMQSLNPRQMARIIHLHYVIAVGDALHFYLAFEVFAVAVAVVAAVVAAVATFVDATNVEFVALNCERVAAFAVDDAHVAVALFVELGPH
uniref:Uncharacterized protein n=1 Tax=Glossina brevipalpis TaxID=37001 RepID=A0A1A9WTT1_9MUSC